MFILVIEFDRQQDGHTLREKRFWAFTDRVEAESEAHRFAPRVQSGTTHILRNGNKLTLQESRLYSTEATDQQTARQLVANGGATLLQHAFNPAIQNPDYWDELFVKLEAGQPIG